MQGVFHQDLQEVLQASFAPIIQSRIMLRRTGINPQSGARQPKVFPQGPQDLLKTGVPVVAVPCQVRPCAAFRQQKFVQGLQIVLEASFAGVVRLLCHRRRKLQVSVPILIPAPFQQKEPTCVARYGQCLCIVSV